jgi:transcriptional regulator GlxA family with amidase domain
MLHLLARLFGRQAAEQVAQMMEYSRAWKANSEALPSYVE